jgi:hypothetical protein
MMMTPDDDDSETLIRMLHTKEKVRSSRLLMRRQELSGMIPSSNLM